MTQSGQRPEGDRGEHAAVDWVAAEESSEFRELVKKRRRFVIPATIFFLGWYTAFVLLAGYAPSFMGQSIYQGLTVGYALALTQFLMVWVLGWLYLRRADRDFDPLARRAAEKAIEVGGGRSVGGGASSDAAQPGAQASAPDRGTGATPAPDGHARTEQPEVSER